MPAPFWLKSDSIEFPDVSLAAEDPPGLLAVGGDLSPERLLAAYARGIFPWFTRQSPMLWWSPDPRMVMRPADVHVSASMRKLIRQQKFSNSPLKVSMDTAFSDVIRLCAELREQQDGTWITPEMQAAYQTLYELGHAHSIEVRQDGKLIGGLYGVSQGGLFFGESMFSMAPNVSKLAFIALALQLQRWGYQLIDCQLPTDHLASLGASPMSRADFVSELAAVGAQQGRSGRWTFEEDVFASLFLS
jgi:leucyl/phenylalanyl-tRNA---protein transferase